MNNIKMPLKINLKFASWFTGTCLYDVKHEKFGKHSLTTEQIKYSTGEYKSKLYENIKKAVENGDITIEKIKNAKE